MNEPHPDSLKGRLQEWRLQECLANLRRELNATPFKDPKYISLRDDLAYLLNKIERAKDADKKVLEEFALQLKFQEIDPVIYTLATQQLFTPSMSESMEEFKPGDIVRSLIRTNEAALFVLVAEEGRSAKPGFFRGAILLNLSKSDELYQPGTLKDNWQTAKFERVSWNDLLSIAAILNA